MCVELGPPACAEASLIQLLFQPFRQDPVLAKCRETFFFFFGLISVLFFRKSLILGPIDSGGRGGGRKHSSPVVYSSVCLTFTAQNHRRVWGSLERHSSSPSFAKFKDKAKTKNKQTKKSKQKKNTRKKESSPGLCFKPLRGEVALCAWDSLWVRRALLFVPSIVGWRGVGRLWVWPCGQGDGHQSGCVPCPTHLWAKQGCSWPFRCMPVGLVAHICPRSRGQMTPLPGLQLFSKPLRIALFHSFKDALLNQCGKTTGLLSVVLYSILIISAC